MKNKNPETHTPSPTGLSCSREKTGTRAGIVGVGVNLSLSVMKFIVGLVTGSIAILADAVNNLSDAASSIVTLVGFRLSAKPADEKHPYGHARSEYIAGLIVAFSMLVVGAKLLESSIEKIITPQAVESSLVTILLLFAAVGAKLFLYFYYRARAAKIDSSTLRAAAADSMNDVITTSAVLCSVAAAWLWGIQIDGYMGAAVSVFVLVSGVKIVVDSLNPLLGTAPDPKFVREIEEKILAHDSVLGIHDLVVHNYGVNRCFATVHVEFSAKQDLLVSHDIIDNIEREFLTDLGIHLVIHLDPVVTDDPFVNEMRVKCAYFVRSIDERLSIHDFRVVRGQTHTNFIFDILVPAGFSVPDEKLRELLCAYLFGISPNYFAVITIDRSYLASVQS